MKLSAIQNLYQNLGEEISKYLVVSDSLLTTYLVTLLAGGHLLLVGPPGVAKTRSARVMSELLGLSFWRIQFTADLLPSDIVGAEIYDPSTKSFVLKSGPIFDSCILVDEINRAPAKVQSALLESMQEYQVTIAGKTLPLPKPFYVIATMNPYDGVGTYTLPEASLDRFLLSYELGYPTYEEEMRILAQNSQSLPEKPISNKEEILEISELAKEVFVDEKIYSYVARIMAYIRDNQSGSLTHGVSTRAALALVHCSQALAAIRGREFVIPEDVKELAPHTLRHRLHLSHAALAQGVTVDTFLAEVLNSVSVEVAGATK